MFYVGIGAMCLTVRCLDLAHDPDFRAAKKDWETFVESLSEKIAEKDNTIPELPAKDLVSGNPSST